MSYKNKYAVPFIDKKISTLDNVVRKTIKGGTGYLKIELPIIPLINECIGFKIKVISDTDSSVLFYGYLSGSESENYKWVNVTYNSEIPGLLLDKNPILFCYKYIDGDTNNDVVKSIIIGDKDTQWTGTITINIEILQSSSKNLSEFNSLSDNNKINGNITDGWNFIIDPNLNEIISSSIDNNLSKDQSDFSIVIDGVVYGVSKTDENGNITITTKFLGGSINLYDSISDSYGFIVADGSKLVGLENNESLKGMTFDSNGFKEPIIIRSDQSSDVFLDVSIKTAGELLTPKINIRKFNLGNWSSDNSKSFSVKTSIDKSSAKNVNLEYGGLGLVNNGLDTDLYVGLGSENYLVGSVKFCNTKSEFDNIDKIDGRLIVYDKKLYVCKDGIADTIKFSDKLSLDEIKNGYFYEKINADAQLGGEIVRLKHDNGFLLSNDLYDHVMDNNIHVSSSDRNRWDNKLDVSYAYSKLEVDKLIDSLPKSDHYHGYHNPINEVLPGDTDFTTHNYPYGHRILVKEYKDIHPYIKIAGYPNEWLNDEEFNIGDRVTGTFGNFYEYVNIDNKVTELSTSGSSIPISISKEGEDVILVI